MVLAVVVVVMVVGERRWWGGRKNQSVRDNKSMSIDVLQKVATGLPIGRGAF